MIPEAPPARLHDNRGNSGEATLIHWQEHYLIGHPRIDFEHRIFFDLIVSYHEARVGGAAPDKLLRILEEIVLYAKFHFKSEENMMQDLGYPGLDEHKALHMRLTEGLGTKVSAVRIGRHQPMDVEAFLVEWFVNHVTHEDTRVSDFVRASH